jgi:hypothetical protein
MYFESWTGFARDGQRTVLFGLRELDQKKAMAKLRSAARKRIDRSVGLRGLSDVCRRSTNNFSKPL